MSRISFGNIDIRGNYSRKALAEMWSYKSFHALARGVVTPASTNKIILFVTESKRDEDEQYFDSLTGGILHWDGPKGHSAEQRMIDAEKNEEEIHLFYRDEHKADFTYWGRLSLQSASRYTDRPSRFTFELIDLKKPLVAGGAVL